MTMASSSLSRLRIKLWLTTLESWAYIRRSVQSLAANPKSRAKFIAACTIVFWVCTTSRSRRRRLPSATAMERQPDKDFRQNPRYLNRELDVRYGKDPGATSRMATRRYTGDSTPFTFPVNPLHFKHQWPTEPSFTPRDFGRQDEDVDTAFYSQPRLLYHIDEPAVASLTQYYRNNIRPGSDILDICSSWVSHYPLEFPDTMGKICATGISADELQHNEQLTGGFKQANLNDELRIPYADSSFDVVTCVVSIDYMTDPIGALQEVHRVLRKGGKAILSQSNRYFPTKAIALWLRTDHHQHLELVNAFFQYAGGFEPRTAYDITAELQNGDHRDPIFVVEAVKA